jgi:2-polyprenyl-6-methoxyphenol hydroxylase-like FAD-dependent oxidoreductase
MLTGIAGWDPALRGIVERVELGSLFEISFGRLDPPDPWPPSRVTRIGDAAHAMLRTLGMGANLALRDARLLTRQLADVDRDDARLIDAIATAESQMRDYTYPFMHMTLDHDSEFGGGGLSTLT